MGNSSSYQSTMLPSGGDVSGAYHSHHGQALELHRSASSYMPRRSPSRDPTGLSLWIKTTKKGISGWSRAFIAVIGLRIAAGSHPLPPPLSSGGTPQQHTLSPMKPSQPKKVIRRILICLCFSLPQRKLVQSEKHFIIVSWVHHN